MKPTSLLLETTLMPQCHWADQFGGCKTLRRKRMSLGNAAENRYVGCTSNSGSSWGPPRLHYKHQGPVHNAEKAFSDNDLSRRSRWKDWNQAPMWFTRTLPSLPNCFIGHGHIWGDKGMRLHLSFPLQNRSACLTAHGCCKDPGYVRRAERGELAWIK